MAAFGYDESSKYFSLLAEDINDGNAVKLGVNGTGVTSKKPKFVSPKSVTFNKKKFQSLNFEKLSDKELVKALKKKDNDYFTDNESGIKYRFTQIFKGTYSGQVKKISTSQQEQITLEIFKEVYTNRTNPYKTFALMFDDKNSVIKKIFPELKSNNQWWNHFELQFNEINSIKDLKSDNYDVYEYTPFMKYITDFVTKDNKWYTSKDSWNPADIWLIDNSKLKKYTDLIDEAKSIQRVNHILKVAANKRHIVGVSLKKSDGEKLKFEWLNLNFKAKKLPNVEFIELKCNTKYDKKTKTFESKTSTFRVKDGSSVFELSFRSNQSKLNNITYEFKKVGGAAQLGKVPKDQMSKWLEEQLLMKLPVATDLDKTFNKKYWNHVVSKIKSQSNDLNMVYKFNDKEVLSNIEDSYSEGLSIKNGIFLQMLEFVYILADYNKMSRNDLNEFATTCFYFAQKKGVKYGFGPFGKLY
jgi:hypothetical protein